MSRNSQIPVLGQSLVLILIEIAEGRVEHDPQVSNGAITDLLPARLRKVYVVAAFLQ